MRVVLLAPSGVVSAEQLTALSAQASIAVISWRPPSSAVTSVEWITLPTRRGFAARLDARARRSAPGRALRRLTPLDPGAAFWTAVRRSVRANREIDSAAICIATERDSTYAAWRLARRHQRRALPLSTVVGYPAARVLIRDRRAMAASESGEAA